MNGKALQKSFAPKSFLNLGTSTISGYLPWLPGYTIHVSFCDLLCWFSGSFWSPSPGKPPTREMWYSMLPLAFQKKECYSMNEICLHTKRPSASCSAQEFLLRLLCLPLFHSSIVHANWHRNRSYQRVFARICDEVWPSWPLQSQEVDLHLVQA